MSRWRGILGFLLAGVVCALAGRALAPPRGLELHVERQESESVSVEAPPVGRRFDASGTGERARRVRYEGWLRVERPGTYRFEVEPNSARLRIAGGSAGDVLRLAPGRHRLSLEYELAGPRPAPLTVRWSRQLPLPRPIPADAVTVPGTPGWRAPAARWAGRMTLVFLSLAGLLLATVWLGPERSRRIAFAFVAMTLAVIGLALVLELVLRAAGARPPQYVPADVLMSPWWREYPGPGTTLDYSGWLPLNVREFVTPVTMNRSGWRDREYPTAKPADTVRLVVVGDSYVEGKEVALADTFHKLLEAELELECSRLGVRVEVVGLGRGGSGTREEVQVLRDTALPMQPDLVVFAVFPGNDVFENSDELIRRFDDWIYGTYVPYIVAGKLAIHERGLLLKRSWLNQFLVHRLMELYGQYAHWFHRELDAEDLVHETIDLYRRGDYDEVWSSAWATTLNGILEARALTAEAGAEFVVLVVHSVQVPGLRADALVGHADSEFDLLRPNRVLRAFCDEQGLECLDLEPVLNGHRERTGESYFWRHDAHWNEVGHRLTAEFLVQRLDDRVREGCARTAAARGEHGNAVPAGS